MRFIRSQDGYGVYTISLVLSLRKLKYLLEFNNAKITGLSLVYFFYQNGKRSMQKIYLPVLKGVSWTR